MKTTVFILNVSLMNEDGSYDYSTIKGVYANREDAKKEALKQIALQKDMWPNSYTIKHNGCTVRLMSETGLCKWYEIKEQTIL